MKRLTFVSLIVCFAFSSFGQNLHKAVAKGNINKVKKAISKGAEINEAGKTGYTPLSLAIIKAGSAVSTAEIRAFGSNWNMFREGQIEIPDVIYNRSKHFEEIAYLLLESGADPNKLSHDQTSLDLALTNRMPDIAIHLLEQGAEYEDNQTHLFLAIECRSNKLLKYLIEAEHQNINIANSQMARPLHLAVERGNQDAVNILLSHGASPNVLSMDGFSPLHIASWNGSPGIVHSLISSGADPNIIGVDSLHPLHFAFFNEKSVYEVFSNSEIQFNGNSCAPEFSYASGKIFQVLSETESDPEKKEILLQHSAFYLATAMEQYGMEKDKVQALLSRKRAGKAFGFIAGVLVGSFTGVTVTPSAEPQTFDLALRPPMQGWSSLSYDKQNMGNLRFLKRFFSKNEKESKAEFARVISMLEKYSASE